MNELDREQLIALGEKLLAADSEEETEELYAEFNKHFAHPDAANLFYYPENYNARRDDLSKYNPTVEEVVDKALSYNTVQL